MTGFTPARCQHRAAPMAALVLILCVSPAWVPLAALAQGRAVSAVHQQSMDTHITDAAQRFGIPEPWIRAVIKVESAGIPRAISSAGAMGLMQIMPATWAELRASFGLGDDPFDPRDNILAGTAYLRAMYDRFGSPGFLAAYNAGPARYEDHLEHGRPLPRETRSYLAALAPIISGGTDLPSTATLPRRPRDWREAPLFTATADQAQGRPTKTAKTAGEAAGQRLFVPLSRWVNP
jgi:soluble lytic murein transglycosylase-like protein